MDVQGGKCTLIVQHLVSQRFLGAKSFQQIFM